MKDICDGRATRADVVHENLEQYREVYVRSTQRIDVLKTVSCSSPRTVLYSNLTSHRRSDDTCSMSIPMVEGSRGTVKWCGLTGGTSGKGLMAWGRWWDDRAARLFGRFWQEAQGPDGGGTEKGREERESPDSRSPAKQSPRRPTQASASTMSHRICLSPTAPDLNQTPGSHHADRPPRH